MLAYVFWHWPQAESDRAGYEARLAEFQQSLAANPASGFRESAVFRLQGAPWLPTAAGGYEDWYLLEGSAGLDPLNEAAVAEACRAAHDAAARLAAGGTAGLYRLRRGEPNLKAARFAYWLGKPAGTRYEDFYARVEPLTRQPGVTLWGRQMTLGPTPEFCLRAPARVGLPSGLSPLELELRRVWP